MLFITFSIVFVIFLFIGIFLLQRYIQLKNMIIIYNELCDIYSRVYSKEHNYRHFEQVDKYYKLCNMLPKFNKMFLSFYPAKIDYYLDKEIVNVLVYSIPYYEKYFKQKVSYIFLLNIYKYITL